MNPTTELSTQDSARQAPTEDSTTGHAATGRSRNAEERGSLTIHRTVLRSIAEHAANTTPDVVPVPRRAAGVEMGQNRASAHIAGTDEHPHVRVEVGVRYPSSVPDTSAAVCRRVSEQLRALAGCVVSDVEVVVSALVAAPARPRVE